MFQEVLLVKTDGTKEVYEPHKLRNSLIKAGAGGHSADKVLTEVSNYLEEHLKGKKKSEVTVSELYKLAFECLKKYAGDAALRYSLKRSLFELGPTGFPFEKYIAEIFKTQGFETLTGQMVMGSCVPHEVDLVAWNADKLIMGEVKYHNDPASKTDLKVALYVSARYNDIKQNMFDYGGTPRKLAEWYLITNTKFTDTAITYAVCNGVKLLSWVYPETGNLHDMIEDTKSHPITCLSALDASQKKMLIDKNVILCRQLHSNTAIMKELHFSEETIFNVLEETNKIITTKK
ncbi:MAG: ATP cone domain-containing protein [bacterium]